MSGPTLADTVLERLHRLLRIQQVAFLVVGAINTAIGLTCFALFFIWWGDIIGYLGSLVLAYGAAIGCGFLLHRRFVFRVRGQVLTDLTRFALVNLASFGLNAVLLTLFVELIGLPVLPAQLVAIFSVVVFSYFGHLLFSFRRTHHHPPGTSS